MRPHIESTDIYILMLEAGTWLEFRKILQGIRTIGPYTPGD